MPQAEFFRVNLDAKVKLGAIPANADLARSGRLSPVICSPGYSIIGWSAHPHDHIPLR